jgi:quercetin dioxygenase-like cupin family protein
MMDIKRNGTQPSSSTAAENFTGRARLQPMFSVGDPVRVRGGRVTFDPGARTNWHTHPKGQTLIITDGSGFVQRWGGPLEPVNPGDVIFFAPAEKHWHGAAPTCSMTHIAVVEPDDQGKSADWLEPVTDEQYAAR